MGFAILTVCTGNICRSPLAEQLLRTALSELSDVTVSSAGTGALVGHPMTDQAQAFSLDLGGTNPSAHRARDLTAQLVNDSDLVLGLSREHRRGAVELVPRASRRVFALQEFARLAAGVTADDLDGAASLDPRDVGGRLAELVDVVASRRGYVEAPESPEDDDVVDPYRRSDEVYRKSASQITPALDILTAKFALALTVGVG